MELAGANKASTEKNVYLKSVRTIVTSKENVNLENVNVKKDGEEKTAVRDTLFTDQ